MITLPEQMLVANAEKKTVNLEKLTKGVQHDSDDDDDALLPILRFVLDEKFQLNASKFAIFYIYENSKLLFPVFILCYFIFSLMNALVYIYGKF